MCCDCCVASTRSSWRAFRPSRFMEFCHLLCSCGMFAGASFGDRLSRWIGIINMDETTAAIILYNPRAVVAASILFISSKDADSSSTSSPRRYKVASERLIFIIIFFFASRSL